MARVRHHEPRRPDRTRAGDPRDSLVLVDELPGGPGRDSRHGDDDDADGGCRRRKDGHDRDPSRHDREHRGAERHRDDDARDRVYDRLRGPPGDAGRPAADQRVHLCSRPEHRRGERPVRNVLAAGPLLRRQLHRLPGGRRNKLHDGTVGLLRHCAGALDAVRERAGDPGAHERGRHGDARHHGRRPRHAGQRVHSAARCRRARCRSPRSTRRAPRSGASASRTSRAGTSTGATGHPRAPSSRACQLPRPTAPTTTLA